jgi:hypothetical protein
LNKNRKNANKGYSPKDTIGGHVPLNKNRKNANKGYSPKDITGDMSFEQK